MIRPASQQMWVPGQQPPVAGGYPGQQAYPQYAGQQVQQIARPPMPQQVQVQPQPQPQVAPVPAPIQSQSQPKPQPIPVQAPASAQFQPVRSQSGQVTAVPSNGASPTTPKMTTVPSNGATISPTQTRVVAGAQQTVTIPTQGGASGARPQYVVTPQSTMQPRPSNPREQALEQRVRELEQIVAQKDSQIKELQAALSKAGVKSSSIVSKVRSPTRAGASGFRQLSGAAPAQRYQAVDPDDPVDVRLEEFYNTTGSSIPFRRINRGFYRFGDTIVDLSIVNHKLMARTEDGWNRGKCGPIEKFLMYYENVEREKAGIPLEP
mmetsp:Transcript_35326/g.75276  ORF Transcript_35326/g.75276 Transcript_35326/m.75276 type:complete len:321 (+) Transcript_35326:293-1255(+)|eukprot:CAMPEP_0206492778 /NCGR_PEP_ID=MMETSP0324_2-20121206/46389_1 /ASSEMBLY_ACC=CAM_ASM_000836 /TAXON_ID=2866 /ORGANISM="Crypthecodinium cohnii, Strain Seligo" /LENGTH=320 /DNA_ID=CAMNT_0053975415 /DNA_START=193 /DNA_END=1155 /DNA_ORIENTATION=+